MNERVALVLPDDAESSPPTMPSLGCARIVQVMPICIGSAAPQVAGDAFVRGEKRRRISLVDYRGSWVVVAFGVRRFEALELAELEESFGADGAVVLAATPDDWDETADRYASEPIRLPLLTAVEETRRLTMIVDPGGVVRHVGLRRTARETLDSLETLLTSARRQAA
jgi:peroxiredoxin